MLWPLLRGDIKFQYKYGFYFLYLFFTILYIGLILAFPKAWRTKVSILMIFTDPSAIGLYFMGAIVSFERSERVTDSIAISPVLPHEYMMSKILSISVISVIVGILIGFFSNAIYISLYFIMGIFLCSSIFSAIGLIIASKSVSLNNFILSTIPAQLLIFIPFIVWLFGYRPYWLMIHPGACMIELCEKGDYRILALLILIFWTFIFIYFTRIAIENMFKEIGGMKL